ncbi:hypothetical protein SAMN05660349_02315 [Macellibacteroides fermentans]|uniref:Uncharacterized protein n=1 Tax=Parabacteroides chartae TaxID=1037355 RepID=A0A1T5D8W6_9BACT|nr:hypothetical protein SAMN05660349_02315 [Parabacteroides chartae]
MLLHYKAKKQQFRAFYLVQLKVKRLSFLYVYPTFRTSKKRIQDFDFYLYIISNSSFNNLPCFLSSELIEL